MTTHVHFDAAPTTFDGFGLTKEVYDWLRASFGGPAQDMTDFTWSRRMWYFRITRSRMNPMYCSADESAGKGFDLPYHLHFFFKDPAQATLFKLAWGGQ